MEHGTPHTVPEERTCSPPLAGAARASPEPETRRLRHGTAPESPGENDEIQVRPTTRNRQGRHLLCAVCGHLITYDGERISIQGAHRHTFANPHGLVFRIGCFRAAPGCRRASRETTDFSWFPGYAWNIQVCGACFTHVGWAYRAEGDGFHGLILERLVEAGRDEPPA